MKTAKYIIPECYLSALVNGDYSGLENQETEALDKFLEDGLKEHKLFWCLGPVDGEGNGFMRYHDLQPYGIGACDTVNVTFQTE